ncbi:hypothetical protein [Nonomuraea soli]|uniref:Uncharacterized protein n=1 Tax=Nonomuraea soli TaxID=1032476 RepID=A0A7W0CDD5_9ACTN|nr:hypothetical protein [Nonomuraea soli]MBA2889083.1 hypothetical protein [Nonomuraea soli]
MALLVVVAGVVLVYCSTLPWVAIEAGTTIISGSFAQERALENPLGLLVLICGIIVIALGATGAYAGRRLLTGLAAVPALAAGVLVVLYLVHATGAVDLRLGNWLTVGTVIQPGCYAALGASLVATLCAVLAISRRNRAGAAASGRAASPSPR